jgi:hypothetical protein
MKIAFCFSGQIRELDKSTDYWKKMIDKYQADVYASFWKEDDESVQKFIDNFSPKKIEFDDFNLFKKTIDQFTKEISVPTYPPQSDSRSWVRSVNYGVANETPDYVKSGNYLSMWYKVWRSNLLSSSENYDIVVRARTDVFLDDNFEITKNEYLNIPVGFIGNGSWKNCWGYVDMFAYGSQEVMDYYSSLYLYLSRYLKDGDYFFPNENLLKVHLAQRDINIRLFINGIFRFRDPEYCFNDAYSGFEESFRSSLDDSLEKDSLFTFFKKLN